MFIVEHCLHQAGVANAAPVAETVVGLRNLWIIGSHLAGVENAAQSCVKVVVIVVVLSGPDADVENAAARAV